MTRTDRPRHGFTLVELLVVVGIIAVLVAMLLPSLHRVREGARQAICMSNLRQLGIGMYSYASENEQYFPFRGDVGELLKEDWIHWQSSRKLRESALAPYVGGLKTGSTEVLRCPSDDTQQRPRVLSEPYRYSYTMNGLLSGRPYRNRPLRLSQFPRPAELVLLVEEDARSVDDGHWHPEIVNGQLENFLATRHDLNRNDTGTDGTGRRKDASARGNIAFADGHAGYVDRAYTQDPKHFDPAR
jgi:prepilin-type N-terminal cleavage/methylation domain-containing protein/prepilin-type processing-associated H-X9-DG protein